MVTFTLNLRIVFWNELTNLPGWRWRQTLRGRCARFHYSPDLCNSTNTYFVNLNLFCRYICLYVALKIITDPFNLILQQTFQILRHYVYYALQRMWLLSAAALPRRSRRINAVTDPANTPCKIFYVEYLKISAGPRSRSPLLRGALYTTGPVKEVRSISPVKACKKNRARRMLTMNNAHLTSSYSFTRFRITPLHVAEIYISL